MIGSYAPHPNPIEKRFGSSQSPGGVLARSGAYAVKSRVVDDEGNIWADWEWAFKIAKEW